jgi:predicted RNase H-like HicB family nuclease
MDIIWSSKAKITFFKVLDYLNENWTKKEMVQFNQRTQIILNAIKQNPGIFPVSATNKLIRKGISIAKELKKGTEAEKTNTGYSAYIPDVPAVIAVGDTFSHLRDNISEAVALYIEAFKRIRTRNSRSTCFGI